MRTTASRSATLVIPRSYFMRRRTGWVVPVVVQSNRGSRGTNNRTHGRRSRRTLDEARESKGNPAGLRPTDQEPQQAPDRRTKNPSGPPTDGPRTPTGQQARGRGGQRTRRARTQGQDREPGSPGSPTRKAFGPEPQAQAVLRDTPRAADRSLSQETKHKTCCFTGFAESGGMVMGTSTLQQCAKSRYHHTPRSLLCTLPVKSGLCSCVKWWRRFWRWRLRRRLRRRLRCVRC
jgi:hypothetical protein